MKKSHYLLYSSFSLTPFKLWLCSLLIQVYSQPVSPLVRKVVCKYVLRGATEIRDTLEKTLK